MQILSHFYLTNCYRCTFTFLRTRQHSIATSPGGCQCCGKGDRERRPADLRYTDIPATESFFWRGSYCPYSRKVFLAKCKRNISVELGGRYLHFTESGCPAALWVTCFINNEGRLSYGRRIPTGPFFWESYLGTDRQAQSSLGIAF